MVRCRRLGLVAGLSLLAVSTHPSSAAAGTNAILFVTQVPMPTEINAREVTSSVCNVTSPFSNHLGDTAACGRGGALWIRYGDGSVTNLTLLAGFGTTNLLQQGTNSIAVREPSVDWTGTKALFSMVVGAPAGPGDTNRYVWQIYEMTNFVVKGSVPVIARVATQPAGFNNVSPTYDSNGRIIFASDKMRVGSEALYPQREEYLQLPTVTGLWSLDPNTGDLFQMEHSPSGSFKPFVDSFGRVLFTRWDHLARDVEAVTDRLGTSTNHVFNWSSESAAAAITTSTTEVFPEPRPSDTNALAGTNMRGNAFNIFLPWQINQDGTAQEIVNHVGRHELITPVQSSTFTNDPAIVTLNANQRFNTNSIANFFLHREDPNMSGLLYGVDALDIGTHMAGQIVALTAATNINPDVVVLNYITPKSTSFPNSFGLYRNPLPLSNGLLIASFSIGTNTDSNIGTLLAPKSQYNFRLMTLTNTGSSWTTNKFFTPGFTNAFTYWVGSSQVTYSGALWELDPVEVLPRAVPTPTTESIDPIEAGVFAEEGVDLPTFRSWLLTNQYALVVSRNVTARDHADRQQPYNLKVAWSSVQTIGTNGTIYPLGYLQLMQADLLRSVMPDGTNALPGRRVLAQPWHDSIDDNPPPLGNIPGTAQLGADGSFAAALPARRAMSWQTINTNGTPIVRERYWVTFQPGEIRTCANCHGINTTDQTGLNPKPTNEPEALRTFLRWWKVVNLPVTTGRIVFNTARDGNYEVYSMNPDGTAVVNLTNTNSTDAIPRVSYDGKTIVFMSDRGHPGNMDIWKMNSDGTGLVNLTHTNLPGASLWAAAPNFDASKIVYNGPRTNPPGYDLYVMNGDGSGVTNLTANTGDGNFPYWSYDGSKIVFDSFRDNNSGEEVYIMNANGSGQTRLTFRSGRDFYPVISPDGSKIAYTAEISTPTFTNRQIYVMNIDGSGQTNISNNTFNDQTAYFSPDGTKLSFTSDRSGDIEVWVMNIDGSNPVRITNVPGQEAYPAWGNIAATPYNLWQQAKLGVIMDDTADPDADGQPNLLEYALGSNPNVPNPPNVLGSPTGFGFTRNLGATDITVNVEATSNLASGSWSNLATRVGAGNWTAAPGVTVTDPGTGPVSVNESNAGTARFYRLRVTHP